MPRNDNSSDPLTLQEQAAQLRSDVRSRAALRRRRLGQGLEVLLRAATVLALAGFAAALALLPSARIRSAEWIVQAATYFVREQESSETLAPARTGPVAPQQEASAAAGRGRVRSPALVSTEAPSWVIVGPEPSAATEKPTGVSGPPQPTGEAAGQAFAMLKKNAIVQKLTSNQIPGYDYVRWEALSREGDTVRIQVIARVAGEEKRLVWEVDLSDGQTRPLSYEARKLGE